GGWITSFLRSYQHPWGRPMVAAGGVQVPRCRRTRGGWLLMGGTLTKELWSCAGVSTCVCRLVRRLRVVCWWVGVVEPHWGTGRGLSSTLLGPQVTGHRLVGCLVRAGPRTTNRFVGCLRASGGVGGSGGVGV